MQVPAPPVWGTARQCGIERGAAAKTKQSGSHSPAPPPCPRISTTTGLGPQIAAALNAPVLMTMTGQPNSTVADYYNRAVSWQRRQPPPQQQQQQQQRR